MGKKNNRKNNKLNVFTEEELKDLELNDDGVLEVGFGEYDSENKKKVPHDKGKQKVGATTEKTSELDKRVAAIIKQLKADTDDEEESDSNEISNDEFEELIKCADAHIQNELDKLPSTRKADKIKKKLGIGDDLTELRMIASRHTGFSSASMIQIQIDELKEDLEDTVDTNARMKIKRKINKLKKEKSELERTRRANLALLNLELVEGEVEHENRNKSLAQDINELYKKYGDSAIKKLLTYNDDEEAI